MENLIWYKKYSMKLEKLEKKKPKDGQRVLICDKYYKTFKISTYIDGCFYDCHTGLHKYPIGAAYYWSSLPKIKEYETNDKKELIVYSKGLDLFKGGIITLDDGLDYVIDDLFFAGADYSAVRLEKIVMKRNFLESMLFRIKLLLHKKKRQIDAIWKRT